MNFIKKIVLFLLTGFMALSVFTSCVVKNPDVPVTKITIHLKKRIQIMHYFLGV